MSSPAHSDAGRTTAPKQAWAFAGLIDPLSPSQFCSEYWSARPFRLQRRWPAFYRNLITLGDLERYLSTDEVFTRHSITTPSREEGPPEPPPSCISEVYDRLLQGRSLRVRRMECWMDPSAPVLSLLRDMELAIGHPRASLSCYLSPAGATGLGPHHDETEIFTLQISGTKRWRLYHRADTRRPGLHEPEELGEPSDDFVLEPGDFLYLPAGYVHHVTSTDVPSFSLTIVFSPFTWKTALELLAERLAESSPLLQSIPAGMLLRENLPDSFRQELERRLDLIRQELGRLTAEDLAAYLAEKHLGRMSLPPGERLEDVLGLDEITTATVLAKRPGTACFVAPHQDRVRLLLPGGYRLEAGARFETMFRQVQAASRPFRISELDPSLGEIERLAAARKFIACGLLMRSDEDGAQFR